MRHPLLFLLVLLTCALAIACNGDGGTTGGGQPIQTTVVLTLTPQNPTINQGETVQFMATGTLNGVKTDITPAATWTSSDPTVASINNVGLATGLKGGQTTITASGGGVSLSTVLTVIGIAQPGQPNAVLNGPTWVATGDVNGDGRADVVATGVLSNAVSVLLGNGDGTVQRPANFSAVSAPISVAVGDLNADGLPDLATANSNTNDSSVLLNQGGGQFGAATNFASATIPSAVAMGDLNNDGRLDLVVSGTVTNGVAALLNNGNGTFQAPLVRATGARAIGLALGHLNADGRLDVVVLHFDAGTVAFALGNGDGTFAAPEVIAVPAGPRNAALADFNQDGLLDVAIASRTAGQITVIPGNGTGLGWAGQQALQVALATSAAEPTAVVAADFNLDGRQDLAVSLAGGGVDTFLSTGPLAFAAPSFRPAGIRALHIATADFNNDGRPDVVTADSSGDAVVILLTQ